MLTIVLVLFTLNIAALGGILHALAVVTNPAAIAVYGQNGSFTTNTASTSASGLSGGRRVVVDSTGGVYVSDNVNNRVLYYPVGSTTATRVYGQADFVSGTVNRGASNPAANTLSSPRGIALDSNNNLYIADAGNNRLLEYLSGQTTASTVYGQLTFTSGTANAGGGTSLPTANGLSQPVGLTIDSSNNLYVADDSNNRILVFPANTTTPTAVYGQGTSLVSFTTRSTGTSSTALNNPVGVGLDSSRNIYVADYLNNRVVVFQSGNATAFRVYGQSTFTSSSANAGGANPTSTTLSSPYEVRSDSSDNIYIVDTGNNRILYYPAGSTTPTRVYGQNGSFTTGTANNNAGTTAVTASTLNSPIGIALVGNFTLYVGDGSNNRVLEFQSGLGFTTQPPAVIGVTTPFSVVVGFIDKGSGSVFTDFSGTITISIKAGSGTSGANITGTLTAATMNGVVTFSSVSIDQPGTGFFLTATSPGVPTGTSNSFIVSGPLLYIPLTSPSFSVTLTGGTAVLTSQHTFQVKDTTELGAGWHVTITSTRFTSTQGNTLPATATTISTVSAACTASTTCVVPVNTTTGYPITMPAAATAPAPITYYTAAGNTGNGDVTITTTFTVTIPPGTASGIYTSVITETLVRGQ